MMKTEMNEKSKELIIEKLTVDLGMMKETLGGFEPSESYDYEIGFCEGAIRTIEDLLKWIKEQ